MIILLPVVIVIDIISSTRSSSLLNAHEDRTPRFPMSFSNTAMGEKKIILKSRFQLSEAGAHAVSISILLSENIKMLSKIHSDRLLSKARALIKFFFNNYIRHEKRKNTKFLQMWTRVTRVRFLKRTSCIIDNFPLRCECCIRYIVFAAKALSRRREFGARGSKNLWQCAKLW